MSPPSELYGALRMCHFNVALIIYFNFNEGLYVSQIGIGHTVLRLNNGQRKST